MNDDEFLRMVQYFYETKGTPERFVGWDERRFRALRPEAHAAWLAAKHAKMLADHAMHDLVESEE